MKLDKILVPLDGSPLAEAALWRAASLVNDGTLSLLRAVEVHAVPGGDPIDAQVAAVKDAEEYLGGVVRRLKDRGVTNVETHVWYGPSAAAIVRKRPSSSSVRAHPGGSYQNSRNCRPTSRIRSGSSSQA